MGPTGSGEGQCPRMPCRATCPLFVHCAHKLVCLSVDAAAYVCMYVCIRCMKEAMNVCMNVFMQVCTHVYMYHLHIHIHIYIYIYISSILMFTINADAAPAVCIRWLSFCIPQPHLAQVRSSTTSIRPTIRPNKLHLTPGLIKEWDRV